MPRVILGSVSYTHLDVYKRQVQDLNDYITDFYSRITYVEKLRETFDDAPLIQ